MTSLYMFQYFSASPFFLDISKQSHRQQINQTKQKKEVGKIIVYV